MSSRRGHNEGSIYKRADGRWVAVVNLGWEDGKRKRKHLYGATRQEAQKKLTKALNDHNRGIPLPDDRQTVEAYLTAWLRDTVKPNRRPLTHRTYESIVNVHITPKLGKVRLSRLTPQQVQALLNAKKDEGLSARRVQLIREVLRNALNEAVRTELLARNVAALAEAPKTAREPVNPFTPDEAKAFLKAAQGHRLEALWTVAPAVGLREGEALGLKWEDVDLTAGTLRVRHALQRVKGQGLQLVEPKSATSRRTVPLPQVAVTALRTHQLHQKQEARWGGRKWHDTGHVFTNKIGKPLEQGMVWREFKALLKMAELRDQRFHDLRHCCASLLLAQGVSARTVMETLGHSQVGLTLNTYSHVMPALQQDAADRIDAALGVQKHS
jgi:integrase